MPVLELDDIDLYYETRGDGEPLLLIHGLGSSTRDWEHQVEYFARHYRVILFDARGHGRSGKPPGPYSMVLFATDAARLLQALDAHPAHVVGISMGGMFAFELALSNAEWVKSLVIVNSGPRVCRRQLQAAPAGLAAFFNPAPAGHAQNRPGTQPTTLPEGRTGAIAKRFCRTLGGERPSRLPRGDAGDRWLERDRSYRRNYLPRASVSLGPGLHAAGGQAGLGRSYVQRDADRHRRCQACTAGGKTRSVQYHGRDLPRAAGMMVVK